MPQRRKPQIPIAGTETLASQVGGQYGTGRKPQIPIAGTETRLIYCLLMIVPSDANPKSRSPGLKPLKYWRERRRRQDANPKSRSPGLKLWQALAYDRHPAKDANPKSRSPGLKPSATRHPKSSMGDANPKSRSPGLKLD